MDREKSLRDRKGRRGFIFCGIDPAEGIGRKDGLWGKGRGGEDPERQGYHRMIDGFFEVTGENISRT